MKSCVSDAGVGPVERIESGAYLEVDVEVVVGESLVPQAPESTRLARPCTARFGVWCGSVRWVIGTANN